MTTNDNTVVGILVGNTSRSSTRTNRRQVVRDVHTETVPVVEDQTVTQCARVTVVSVQEARVFIHQDFHQDGIDHQPTTLLVNVLNVQQTAHTVDQHDGRNVVRRQGSGTGQTSSNRDRVVSFAGGGDVAEGVLTELHRSQQFVRASSRDSLGTVDNIVHSTSSSVDSSLLVARQVTKDFLVMLVSQTIGCTVGGQVHEVHMRVCFFDVIHFECKVVSLVDNQREVSVLQVLCLDLRTTSIRRHRDFRLFDDANSVTLCRDFTEVVRVSDVANSRSFTEGELNFLRIDDRREVTIGQVRITSSGLESHEKILLRYLAWVRS